MKRRLSQALSGAVTQTHLNQIERRITLERAWGFWPAGAMLVAPSVLFGYIAWSR